MVRLCNEFVRIQRRYPFFNQDILTSEDLLVWAESMGIFTIHVNDASVPHACITRRNGNLVILYNPRLSETDLTLAIGHDLMHALLGHVGKTGKLRYSNPVLALYGHNRKEKDASIGALLCLLPANRLMKLKLEGRLSPEDLYADLVPQFGDYEGDIGLCLCRERIKIFHQFMEMSGGECL